MALRTDDEHALCNRGRAEDDLAHLVLRQLLECRTSFNDKHDAFFVDEIQPAVSADRGCCELTAAPKPFLIDTLAGFRSIGGQSGAGNVDEVAVNDRRGKVGTAAAFH